MATFSQDELNRIVSEALDDPNLKTALEAYQMGQQEYERALNAHHVVTFVSGDSTTPHGSQYAGVY